jgi:glycosyltransferase involved in cell wall biosynthesis
MNSLLKQLRRLSCFVVLSEEDNKNWPELNNKVVIPNSLSYFPDFQSTCENKRVIAVGRYTWQKGFDLLLKAWRIVFEKHPDWHLDIYGSGEREEYEQLAKEFGISEVVTCHPATNDVYDKYRESSIFAFSSRYEGFGLVLAEAMSTGVPAVSFACPCGPSDIIRDYEDGILVEEGNIQQFAESLCYMIEHNDERKTFGHKARISSQRFGQESIMKKWINLFDEIRNEC